MTCITIRGHYSPLPRALTLRPNRAGNLELQHRSCCSDGPNTSKSKPTSRTGEDDECCTETQWGTWWWGLLSSSLQSYNEMSYGVEFSCLLNLIDALRYGPGRSSARKTPSNVAGWGEFPFSDTPHARSVRAISSCHYPRPLIEI